jgi:hypothetical protein
MKVMVIRAAVFGALVGAYLISPVAGVLGLLSGVAYAVWQRKRLVDVRS